jgi:hypothetical protein
MADKLHTHAGSATLHAYNLSTHTWQKFTDAPAEDRYRRRLSLPRLFGGQASHPLLSHSATLTTQHQMFHSLEVSKSQNALPSIYIPSTDNWTTVYPDPNSEHGFPGPQSIHGLVSFSTSTHTNTTGPGPVALLYQVKGTPRHSVMAVPVSFGVTRGSSL